MTVNRYDDFVSLLLETGFTVLVGGGAGAPFALLQGSWTDTPPEHSPIRWHTGDPDTDPWQWRIRLLTERDDVAYAKLFFGRAGYVTREWAPFFLSARRRGRDLGEAYEDGLVSRAAKLVYDEIAPKDGLSMFKLRKLFKQRGGWGTEHERALIELQRRMDITVAGEEYPESHGRSRGWPSSVFTTSERFWSEDLMREAARLDAADAAGRIEVQIARYYPNAKPAAIRRFIEG